MRSAVRGTGVALLTAGIIILAINMRAAITSLPPIFPELHGALHLSAASQSVLAASPVLCFGLFSGIAAPLSRAFGEERVLGVALVLLAAGLVLRGAAPSALLLPGTVIAGSAIALMNVLLPSLVKRRRPERAGLLIGLYLMSLSAGAIVASLIAVPVYQAAGGSAAVRLSLGMWALPALIAAAVWLPQFRYRTEPGLVEPAVAGPAAAEPVAGEAGPVANQHHRLGSRDRGGGLDSRVRIVAETAGLGAASGNADGHQRERSRVGRYIRVRSPTGSASLALAVASTSISTVLLTRRTNMLGSFMPQPT